MGLGELDGTLLGPGAGIVLGRHANQSSYKGRIVVCGATGYVGDIPGGQSMAVWTSDDQGKTYQLSTGTASQPIPYKGLAECQVVELTNGSVMVNARNEIKGGEDAHHRAATTGGEGQNLL